MTTTQKIFQLDAQLDVVKARIDGAQDMADWLTITQMLNSCNLLSRRILALKRTEQMTRDRAAFVIRRQLDAEQADAFERQRVLTKHLR